MTTRERLPVISLRARLALALLLAPWSLSACSVTAVEEISSLAAKPALPYSVFITGGAFVHVAQPGSGPLDRTYDLTGPSREAFDLARLQASLGLGNVFVATSRDEASAAARGDVADLSIEERTQAPALRQTLDRARAGGHDFALVVERIQDGPVESRGINDRWPFTVGAWLFALALVVPDRTYESRAGLRVCLRDVYSGRRIIDHILVTPGPVDLNMLDRCGLWGFVQSVIVPPFWTATDPVSIVESVRRVSTERLMVSLVRRLKSAEVDEKMRGSGPAKIVLTRAGRVWRVTVASAEVLSAADLRLDGKSLDDGFVRGFERALLASRRRGGPPYHYSVDCELPLAGRLLQVLVQTQAARNSSVTWLVGRR